MVIIEEKDRRLLEFGKQLKKHFEGNDYICGEMRTWNNEYELSLHKPGDFGIVHTEMLNLLIGLGFMLLNDGTGRRVYENPKEKIGCVIDEDRYYISLFSDFKVSQ